MPPHGWYAVRELHCNAGHKFASVPDVAAATREEEARCQLLPVVMPARHCPGDGRFACARQSVQPKDAPIILAVRPGVYLVEESDARIGEACRLVLLRERVEAGIGSLR